MKQTLDIAKLIYINGINTVLLRWVHMAYEEPITQILGLCTMVIATWGSCRQLVILVDPDMVAKIIWPCYTITYTIARQRPVRIDLSMLS